MDYFAEIEAYFETLKTTVDQVDRKEIQKTMEVVFLCMIDLLDQLLRSFCQMYRLNFFIALIVKIF
jgi:hypothetical protein